MPALRPKISSSNTRSSLYCDPESNAPHNALDSYKTTVEDVPSPSKDPERLGSLRWATMNGSGRPAAFPARPSSPNCLRPSRPDRLNFGPRLPKPLNGDVVVPAPTSICYPSGLPKQYVPTNLQMPTPLEVRNSVPVPPLAVPRPGTPIYVPTPSMVRSSSYILPLSQISMHFCSVHRLMPRC